MNLRPLGKILAVVSALALGGTYVAYRQNQSQPPGPGGEEETPLLPGSKNSHRATVLPSSKNIDAVLGGSSFTGNDHLTLPDPPSGEQEKPLRDTFLGSSKSGRILIPADQADDETEKHPEVRKALLSSSKVGAILSPKDVPVNRDNIDDILDQRWKEEKEEAEPERNDGKK